MTVRPCNWVTVGLSISDPIANGHNRDHEATNHRSSFAKNWTNSDKSHHVGLWIKRILRRPTPNYDN